MQVENNTLHGQRDEDVDNKADGEDGGHKSDDGAGSVEVFGLEVLPFAIGEGNASYRRGGGGVMVVGHFLARLVRGERRHPPLWLLDGDWQPEF